MTKKLLNKKIVILDACTVSNGDVDFGTFESLGDVKIYDVLNGDELTEACREAEVLLVNKTRVDEKLISACPRLELICLFATGYDNVDIEAAKRRGITVCNVPRYSAQSVTQHVFAMLLEYVRNISRFESFVANGGWTREGGRAIFAYPIENLAGKTFGILGFGSIGSSVGNVAAALGMKVLYHSATRKKNLGRDFRYADLDTLFKRSDFLSLHCPLNEETRQIVNKRTLSLMKPRAVLINTARGGLVDETALAEALDSGRFARRRGGGADKGKQCAALRQKLFDYAPRRMGGGRDAAGRGLRRCRQRRRFLRRLSRQRGQRRARKRRIQEKNLTSVLAHTDFNNSAAKFSYLCLYSNRRVITQSVIIPDFFFYLIKLLHHRAVPKCFKVI